MPNPDSLAPNPARTSPAVSHYTEVGRALRTMVIRGLVRLLESKAEARELADAMLAGERDLSDLIAKRFHGWGGGIDSAMWGGVDQVYLIQMMTDGATKPVKIGRSLAPHRRLAAHQSSSPFELTLLASFPSALTPEYSLHDLLRRDRMRGEWFAPSPRALAVADWMRALMDRYPPPVQAVA